MTQQELCLLIENMVNSFPEKITGNEVSRIVAERLSNVVITERDTLVSILRGWINIRILKTKVDLSFSRDSEYMFLALEIAEKYGLKELCPDITNLVRDTRKGKTYLPYYADMMEKYLKRIQKYKRDSVDSVK
jgi:hypothetical protein